MLSTEIIYLRHGEQTLEETLSNIPPLNSHLTGDNFNGILIFPLWIHRFTGPDIARIDSFLSGFGRSIDEFENIGYVVDSQWDFRLENPLSDFGQDHYVIRVGG